MTRDDRNYCLFKGFKDLKSHNQKFSVQRKKYPTRAATRVAETVISFLEADELASTAVKEAFAPAGPEAAGATGAAGAGGVIGVVGAQVAFMISGHTGNPFQVVVLRPRWWPPTMLTLKVTAMLEFAMSECIMLESEPVPF